jgi:hypothetical protein
LGEQKAKVRLNGAALLMEFSFGSIQFTFNSVTVIHRQRKRESRREGRETRNIVGRGRD